MAICDAELTVEQIQAVRQLSRAGLHLQALELARRTAPWERWCSTPALLARIDLCDHLGAPSMGRWLLRQAYRQSPDDWRVRCYQAAESLRWRGPYAVLGWMDEQGDPAESVEDDTRRWWFCTRALCFGLLRDFGAAHRWLAVADKVDPTDAWIEVCRSAVLRYEDRYAEALVAAERAMARRPWYAPAVATTADLLSLLNRDHDAVALLQEASARTESLQVVAELYALQFELCDFAGAAATLDQCDRLGVLAGRAYRRWLLGQRGELAYQSGDLSTATRLWQEAGGVLCQTFVERLADPQRAAGRAVRLPVGFVRQHHRTCGPATLAALSQHWGKPAEHLQVAAEICYDGTSSYSERSWAQRNGWRVREFTVTAEATQRLIDRGVPFTLTTIDAGNAHLQAVVGYDSRRGTLIIRDPTFRNRQEFLAEPFFERYRALGPRGMALVPEAEAARLADLDLPDAAAWDALYALDDALTHHRRAAALAIIEQLQTEGHWMAAEAERRLATYDANPQRRLAATERQLERTPRDGALRLQQLYLLQGLSQREQRLRLCADACAQWRAAPVFLQFYANELRQEAPRRGEALALARRAVRRAPMDANGYYTLAHIYWDLAGYEEAYRLYWMAVCLDEQNENLADSYFTAARSLKRIDEALTVLTDRFRRFGAKASYAARTLVQAYMRLDRTDDTIRVVEEALAMRPDDGSLLLFAAEIYVSCSMACVAHAQDLLERAEPLAPRAEWLATAAWLTSIAATPAAALPLWEELLLLQPLAIGAHRAVARIVAMREGEAAVCRRLGEAVARFPHYQPLYQLWLEWLRRRPAEEREAALATLVEANPDDAWLAREQGFFFVEQNRVADGWKAEAQAARFEPEHPAIFNLRGELLNLEDKGREARAALQEAIRQSVDQMYAIHRLIELCHTVEERRQMLAFVRKELARQVMTGDGLLAFRTAARDTLSADEILKVMREALAARPDLWQSWAGCARQLNDMQKHDEAQPLLAEATQRFPLLPVLWLDVADACRARNDEAGEREALETAYRINPHWSVAVTALADFSAMHGNAAQAEKLLEQEVARDPLDLDCLYALAEKRWGAGKREEAFADVQRLLDIDPLYERGWNALGHCAKELGRPEVVLNRARKLAADRPDDAQSHLRLARALEDNAEIGERLAALDRSLAIAPRLVEAHDLRAWTLSTAGRHDEARQACRPAALADWPAELHYRAAWVEAQAGSHKKAVRLARKLIKREPNHFQAWSSIWDWSEAMQDYVACREAGEAMIAISPQYAVSWGYAGQGYHLTGANERARQAFERSIELDPTYTYGAQQLFDMTLASGDLRCAERALELLENAADDPYTHARQVQLWLRCRRHDDALKTLAKLCREPCESSDPLRSAAIEVCGAGKRRAAVAVLDEALGDTAAQAEVGDLWVKFQHATHRRRCVKRLAQDQGKTPAQVEATIAFLKYDVDHPFTLRRFIRQNAAWLAGNQVLWTSTLNALNQANCTRTAAKWTEGWRSRTLDPWTCVVLLRAIDAVGCDSDARAVANEALRQWPDSKYAAQFHAWLALDAAYRGLADQAMSHLENAKGGELDRASRLRYDMTPIVVSLGLPPDRAPSPKATRQAIIDAASRARLVAERDPEVRRIYRRAAWHVVRRGHALGLRFTTFLDWLAYLEVFHVG